MLGYKIYFKLLYIWLQDPFNPTMLEFLENYYKGYSKISHNIICKLYFKAHLVVGVL